MGELRAIAAFQMRELLQRRIVWLIVLVALLGLAFMGWAVHTVTADPRAPAFVRGQITERMLTMTLVLSAMLTALLAVLTAVSALAAEIDSGRIQMVLSRPVSRRTVFLGHLLGLAAVVAGYAAALYLAVLLVYGAASGYWPGGWAWGILVFPLGALIQLALALLLSTRLGTLAAGVAALALLLLTWIGNGLETVGYLARIQTLQVTGVLMSLLLPMAAVNDGVTSHLRDGLQQAATVPLNFSLAPAPSTWMLLYALCYLLVLVAAGLAVFRRRDL